MVLCEWCATPVQAVREQVVRGVRVEGVDAV